MTSHGLEAVPSPGSHLLPLQRGHGKCCGYCGESLTGKQEHWCSETCRWKAWDAKNPRQRALDFLPAARELGAALDRRESKASRILARLRQGPANSLELLKVGGIRYSARVFELRQAGHRIRTEDRLDYAVYSLEEP